MIHSFTVTNSLGDRLTIELGRPAKSGFLVRSVSGLGPAKADIHTTETATNDGSLFNSARLNQRNIVFDLVFVETETGESIEDVRQKSYRYFPLKQNLELLIQTDNRLVKTSGRVESNEPTIFSAREGGQVSLICPDPFFYSAGADGIVTTIFYGIAPEFEFPFSNESPTEPMLIFGEIYNKTENVINYKGDAETGITIRIHAIGDVEMVTVYNLRTREQMKINTDRLAALTGSGLIASDDIVINTAKGEKSVTLVRDGRSTNILNCLDKNTDWFTLSKGDNVFAFTAESGVSNLQFRIENKVVYEGV